MAEQDFSGLHTAIVTPFDQNHRIDEEAYVNHLHYQAEGGVDGIVVSGTTGESPSLTGEEYEYLLDTAVEEVGDDCLIIAGSGSNNTRKTIEVSRKSEELGADGLLIVAPYYNKPEQRGLIEHYTRIADAVDIPIIIYNVPGRTGVNVEAETVAELSAHSNIVAVKEASGDVEQAAEIVAQTSDDFDVLSGEDALTLQIMASGGVGAISVASNVYPSRMKEFVDFGLNNEMVSARQLHYELLPLMNAGFWETNPIPVKAALSIMGRMKNQLRLPLVPLDIEYEERMLDLLEDYGLVEEE
jgi:4-hydroxy-tetrahydrodipicolinate synthase